MYFLGFCVGFASDGQLYRCVQVEAIEGADAFSAEVEAFNKMSDFPEPKPICFVCEREGCLECGHYRRMFDRTPYESEAQAERASAQFVEYSASLFDLTLPDGSRRILRLDEPHPARDELMQL